MSYVCWITRGEVVLSKQMPEQQNLGIPGGSTDDFCHALDQSEKSYQLLGGYAAGQLLYRLEIGSGGTRYIVFCPERSNEAGEPPRVKLPTLHASVQHLKEVEYDGIN
ncbi:hypothetical protein RHGRI_029887 [Rhododendron griersonianum]|uniref:Uncharacterized protein n=1 Tax=Rhododendron griersonianum TaxID=479676 RepID=A0AAV6IN61_9ERIC|nr:hypothetical protein RHGRI_029887 [Rhododendron griersonianum]